MWKFYTGDDSPGFKMYVPLVLNPDAARVTGFFVCRSVCYHVYCHHTQQHQKAIPTGLVLHRRYFNDRDLI